ncbi:Oidioi.mRNA.OKI2018_I69.YSR.g17040.t1.cds [Oikopleura dioica]|uniref:Oidioi.mRNA.OKI2018_I69.YSR.g17040.t1.cds n=1 Tax=Oikopleura dioica TaxID=34765 RepID=A0ABN7SSB8_OIKDI|nr:Oidioi.mRNA.OKI2018_I69.YSR.g17040.t1.cds [Oikopleura dioica]
MVSLFMMTLRPEDYFLEELLEKEERQDFELFLETIGKHLAGTSSSMMNEILRAKRRPQESLLAFFIRLCTIYKASSGKNPKSQEAAMFLYPVIRNNATRIQKTELSRDLEAGELGKAAITFDRLRAAIKVAQVMDDSNFHNEPAELTYNIEERNYFVQGHARNNGRVALPETKANASQTEG